MNQLQQFRKNRNSNELEHIDQEDVWNMILNNTLLEDNDLILLKSIHDRYNLSETTNLEKRKLILYAISFNKLKRNDYYFNIDDITKDKKYIINSMKSKSVMEHLDYALEHLRNFILFGDTKKDKYGEVLTPEYLVNDMLNILPEEVWTNPNLKWLDPANGPGIYPICIIKRLMKGLENVIPNDDERYKHIIENMIYVCELQPVNMVMYYCLVDPCDKYDVKKFTGSFLSQDFDKCMSDIWNVDKFDIILGNPPYNEERRSDKASEDLYPKFVEKSHNLSKNIVLMITPSRWFIKQELSSFRENMLYNYGLYLLNHYTDNKLFNNTDIKGGVSFFLLKKGYTGDLLYNGKVVNFKNLDIIPTNIEYLTLSIINKVVDYTNITHLYNAQKHFKIQTNDKRFVESGKYKVYVSQHKGYVKYINDFTPSEKMKFDKFKVVIPAACGKGGFTDPFYIRVIIAKPFELCSGSFIFFDFESLDEANNFKSYLETRFFAFLVQLRKMKQDVTKTVFHYVPNVPLNESWSDEKLFKYFNLTDEEQKWILSFDSV